jgi:hypothetical protein
LYVIRKAKLFEEVVVRLKMGGDGDRADNIYLYSRVCNAFNSGLWKEGRSFFDFLIKGLRFELGHAITTDGGR